MLDMTPHQYLELYKRLKADRSNYDSLWQDLAKYCIPRKSYITRERTPGQKFDSDVFDSTAMQSTLVLAAGLHSYLTNPATKWFTLALDDPKLQSTSEVKQWLSDSEEEIYTTLNHSNFSEQIHEGYLDLSVFGTCFICEEEDEKDRIRFYSRPVQECYILEDDRGRVDTIVRDFKITAKQAYDKWGDNAGEKVKKLIEKKDLEQMVEFVHIISPRYRREGGKIDTGNMPFASVYIEPEMKKIVNESGYMEFPFFVPRFNKDSGEKYGSSPAMVSYADIKMLNEMDYTLIRAAQKIVDPPLMLPHDGYLLPIKLAPAAINYKVRGSADDRVEPLITHGNIPVGMEMEEVRRTIIKRNFFVDLFLLLADPAKKNMTATEVMQRVEEKMLILAPTLGRLMNELLDPIINRTFNILARNKIIPPPPPSIQGKSYKIVYTSPLARAQRLEEMKALNSVMITVGQIAPLVPSILDKIDTDAFVDTLGDIYNINPELIRDEKEVGAIRAAREKALAQQQQMITMQSAAQTAKTGAEALKTSKEASGGAE